MRSALKFAGAVMTLATLVYGLATYVLAGERTRGTPWQLRPEPNRDAGRDAVMPVGDPALCSDTPVPAGTAPDAECIAHPASLKLGETRTPVRSRGLRLD